MEESSVSDGSLADGTAPITPRRATRQGILTFVVVAVEQLPNMPSAIAWHFKNRIWLPIIFIVLEIAAFFGCIKMKSLEKELSKPYRPKR